MEAILPSSLPSLACPGKEKNESYWNLCFGFFPQTNINYMHWLLMKCSRRE
jgi:hypothetical protein